MPHNNVLTATACNRSVQDITCCPSRDLSSVDWHWPDRDNNSCHARFEAFTVVKIQVEVTSLWRWKHHVPPKRCYPTATLRGITTQKALTWIHVISSNKSKVPRRRHVLIVDVRTIFHAYFVVVFEIYLNKVKVKLSIWLCKYHTMKAYWGSGGNSATHY
jgi:hypothetical protein